MKILLDTNFILTCTKEHIPFKDLVDEKFSEGIEWLVPQQVLNELGNLKDREEHSRKDRDAAALSFELLQELDPEIVDIGKNPNVDIAIINYIVDKDIVLATLDRGLKNRLSKHKILTIRGKNSVDII